MKYLFIIIFFIGTSINAQNIYEYKFSKIEYFAPASMNLPQQNEILYTPSIITLDTNNHIIHISTLHTDNEIIKNTYRIKSITDLGELYKFVCIASNYSEVLIEVNTKSNWIRRTVIHNNITHKYYN